MPTFTHGKSGKVYVNGVDLSGFFKEYSNSAQVDVAETSAFGTNGKSFVQGMNNGTLSLSGMWDGSAAAVDEVLAATVANTNDSDISISPNGLFTRGSRILCGQSITTNYQVSGSIGDIVAVSLEAQGNGGFRSGTSLGDFVSQAATAARTETSIDNAVATTGGAYMVVQVTVNASTAPFVVRLQHSSDNTTFPDLATVTIPATTIGGFYAVSPLPATVNRYLRLVSAATTTGAATLHAAVVRL